MMFTQLGQFGEEHTDTEDSEMAFHMHTPSGESSCCLYIGWI